MEKTRFGTFEDLEDLTEEPLKPIVRKLREVIFETDPEACEVVRLGDRAATYGVGPKKMSEGYCYIMPHKRWVNLGFYKGVGLDDPEGLLEGTGKNLRHVKIKTPDDAGLPAVRELIRAAFRERRSALKG